MTNLIEVYDVKYTQTSYVHYGQIKTLQSLVTLSNKKDAEKLVKNDPNLKIFPIMRSEDWCLENCEDWI